MHQIPSAYQRRSSCELRDCRLYSATHERQAYSAEDPTGPLRLVSRAAARADRKEVADSAPKVTLGALEGSSSSESSLAACSFVGEAFRGIITYANRSIATFQVTLLGKGRETGRCVR